VRLYGAQRADARPGPVAAARAPHDRLDGSDASLAFLAGSLSSDIIGHTVVIVARRERAHTGPGHAK